MSLKKVGKVLELFVSKKETSQRYKKETLEFDTNGVVEDKFYGKNQLRSVLLTSIDSYNLTKQHNIDIEYGTLGENVLMDFNPYKLGIGTQLQISNVILEISQECTICSHLSSVNEQLPILLKKDRGIFVKVVQNGTINNNDDIFIVE